MSDGGWPPVGGQFRQPDRAPFFRLTQAFGLRSLRKNGYVPKNDLRPAGSSADIQYGKKTISHNL